MSRKLTRRDFLRLSSITIGAAAFTTLSPTDLRLAQPLTSLGRITINPPNKARVLNRPHRLGETIAFKDPDEVVTVYRAVVGEGFFPHNHVWIEIPEGYVYSSLIQPVKDLPQTPVSAVPPGGFYAEVSVPYTDAYNTPAPEPSAEVRYRLYYSVVLKIKNSQPAADGNIWYEVDDENENQSYWALGRHFRPITASEIAPISPGIDDKRIVADLDSHWLSAYEGKTEVFRTRFASGATFFEPDGSERAAITPGGVHPIWSKRISRHMEGGVFPNGYDLPGIGWVSYWHSNGAAIHSTYWHNDYGRPRSHGCLNCPPEAAKWLFRWTTPEVDYSPGNITVTWPGGTRVEIHGSPPPLNESTG